MAREYAALTINRDLAAQLHAIRTKAVKDEAARQDLGELLQSALELEFATIPTYLSAAFSLYPSSSNEKIYDLILRVAIEEMLHMSAVANLMNAIGVAPNIVAAVPKFPCTLNILKDPLTLNLGSFSFDLIEDLFMRIEAPEKPIHYKVLAMAARPKTIGQFYAGIIDIIQRDIIPDLFKNAERDRYKQVEVKSLFNKSIAYASNQDSNKYPLKSDIDFMITDKASAVRHLSWIVDQGEGESEIDPLTLEGLPGHFYRFESIVRLRYLVKDANAVKEYSFSGGDLPLEPAGVHEFDANAKASDYANHQAVMQEMSFFNDDYTSMVNSLETAFNCPRPEEKPQAEAAYQEALGLMRNLQDMANLIIRAATIAGVKGGIPFEYTGSPIA